MPENLITIYAVVFYGTVVTLAGLEMWPRLQRQAVEVGWRWPTNIGLYALNASILSICVPLSAVGVAELAGPGVFDLLPADMHLRIIVGVITLDFWSYLQHRVMHAFPPLWRVHLVHHSDVEVDFTTTERHHPLETAVSVASLFVLIYALAIPPLAVVIYALAAAIVSLVSHANVRLPDDLDRVLRWVVVTPAMHMIHHSALRDETDSSYGLVFSVWDRLFGTYREPRRFTEGPIPVQGLEYFRDSRDARIDRVLCQPFRFSPADRSRSAAGPRVLDEVL